MTHMPRLNDFSTFCFTMILLSRHGDSVCHLIQSVIRKDGVFRQRRPHPRASSRFGTTVFNDIAVNGHIFCLIDGNARIFKLIDFVVSDEYAFSPYIYSGGKPGNQIVGNDGIAAVLSL